MIRYQNEQPVSERTNVRGGEGAYLSKAIFSPQEAEKTMLFAVNTMPPHTSIGVHEHTTEAEAYLILSGEAEVTEDGKTYVLHAGDAEYCTDGHTHGIANRSDREMSFLAIIMK